MSNCLYGERSGRQHDDSSCLAFPYGMAMRNVVVLPLGRVYAMHGTSLPTRRALGLAGGFFVVTTVSAAFFEVAQVG